MPDELINEKWSGLIPNERISIMSECGIVSPADMAEFDDFGSVEQELIVRRVPQSKIDKLKNRLMGYEASAEEVVSTGTWRSPNEMFDKAKEMMLGGRSPETEEDWARIVHFWCANAHRGTQPASVLLLCKIYDCPLEEDYIKEISRYQIERRPEK
jgi:hypothetical protein